MPQSLSYENAALFTQCPEAPHVDVEHTKSLTFKCSSCNKASMRVRAEEYVVAHNSPQFCSNCGIETWWVKVFDAHLAAKTKTKGLPTTAEPTCAAADLTSGGLAQPLEPTWALPLFPDLSKHHAFYANLVFAVASAPVACSRTVYPPSPWRQWSPRTLSSFARSPAPAPAAGPAARAKKHWDDVENCTFKPAIRADARGSTGK
eukprot:gene5208-5275_t